MILNALNRTSYNIASFAISVAMQMSIQDSRVRKITSGIGFTISGLNFIATSGVLKNFKSRCCAHEETQNWRSAAFGLATTCYGIYHVTMGLWELTDHHPIQDSCEARLAQAKETLLSCPKAKQIWNEVETYGSLGTRCALNGESAAQSKFGDGKGEIIISKIFNEKEMVRPMLFELINLRQSEMISVFHENKCQLEVDEFAHTIEKIEYVTGKLTHEVSKTCIENQFWPLEAFQPEPLPFEADLEIQEQGGHTDVYRLQWYKECNPEGLEEWIEKNIDKWLKRSDSLKTELEEADLSIV